jgi:hypothetical protein
VIDAFSFPLFNKRPSFFINKKRTKSSIFARAKPSLRETGRRVINYKSNIASARALAQNLRFYKPLLFLEKKMRRAKPYRRFFIGAILLTIMYSTLYQ